MMMTMMIMMMMMMMMVMMGLPLKGHSPQANDDDGLTPKRATTHKTIMVMMMMVLPLKGHNPQYNDDDDDGLTPKGPQPTRQ